jgi:hypothetical protein
MSLIISNVSSISRKPKKKRLLTEIDDIDLVHGAPVGVQVITPKLQEEKCIAVAKVIEDSLAALRTAEKPQRAKL